MELLAVTGIIFAKKSNIDAWQVPTYSLLKASLVSFFKFERILQTNLVVLLFAVNKKQLMNRLTIICSKSTTETIEKGVK